MPLLKGTMVFDDAIGAKSFKTEEALTFTIDSGGGTDPTEPLMFSRQAQITAHGSFATPKAALAAMPPVLAHEVRLEFVDGAFTAAADSFQGLSRLTFELQEHVSGLPNTSSGGHLVIASANGLVQTGGTSNLAVTSSTFETVTLAADPGYSVNQYRGYWLYVLSGTGSGQLKAIRSHTGATFQVVDDLSPALDATSVVQIVNPAASVDWSSVTNPKLQFSGFYNVNAGLYDPPYVFENIDFTSSTPKTLFFASGSILTEGMRIRNIALSLDAASVFSNRLIVDGLGTAGSAVQQAGLITIDSGFFRSYSTTGSTLIRDGLGSGMALTGDVFAAGCAVTMFSAAIDDNDFHGIFARDRGYISLNGSRLHSTGNGQYGVAVEAGALVIVNAAVISTAEPTGTSGDIRLDGSAVTWAEVGTDDVSSPLGTCIVQR